MISAIYATGLLLHYTHSAYAFFTLAQPHCTLPFPATYVAGHSKGTSTRVLQIQAEVVIHCNLIDCSSDHAATQSRNVNNCVAFTIIPSTSTDNDNYKNYENRYRR